MKILARIGSRLLSLVLVTSTAPAETYSVLSLGTRVDAATWAAGLKKELKMQSGVEITSPNPTVAQIKGFFERSDDWIYIAGHFTESNGLYNESNNIRIKFETDRVKVTHPDGDFELKQGTGFGQHKNLKAIFWGGCSTHAKDEIVKTHRKLFGATAVSIGWNSITGWEISDIVLGGKGNGTAPQPSNFFTHLKGNSDPAKIVPAWLTAADAVFWGKDSGGNPYRPRFSAIDPGGREYVLIGDVDAKKGWLPARKW